jgi:hypothetical protein
MAGIYHPRHPERTVLYRLYAKAHREKIRKASLALSPFLIVEEEIRPVPSKGWTDW